MRDNTTLLKRLGEEYLERFPRVSEAHIRAKEYLIHGGSHTLRLSEPYPLRINGARGATVADVDGHEILDFWQGHYANILGHNSPLVIDVLGQMLAGGYGLHTGIVDDLQTEYAEVLLGLTGAERVRFTTSGSLANLYAMMLARAFTGRQLILKVGGGWQGGQPLSFKGVSYRDGYDHGETEGLTPDEVQSVRITRYNDPQDLEECFRKVGDQLACFIVEPWIGMGGFIPASSEYLGLARELADRNGALLIFDEIISGFRFCASGVQKLFGIEPDLTTFAKIIGGGMPLAAVVGREEIMRLCGPESERRVKFDGGTFSGHPACLLAGKTVLSHLAEHEQEIYPRLAELGERMRSGVEEAFRRHDVYVRCTGYGNDTVPGSSVGMVNFPFEEIEFTCPDQIWNPDICDVERREHVLKLALLLERVHVMHGLGVLSIEHSEEHLEWLFGACEQVASRFAGSS
jgi:glutamate-1-semialdehyde 2,1-aminomutase